MLLLFGDGKGEIKNLVKLERYFYNNQHYNAIIVIKMKVTFGFAIDKQNAFCHLDEQWASEAVKYFVTLQTSDFKQH